MKMERPCARGGDTERIFLKRVVTTKSTQPDFFAFGESNLRPRHETIYLVASGAERTYLENG